jgi:membrane protein implicated in regulation of membrane protease activity
MGKLMGTGALLGSVVVGAVAWFVLFVILGVTLWVSFVVWAAIVVVGLLLVAPMMRSRGKAHDSSGGHSGSPIGAH